VGFRGSDPFPVGKIQEAAGHHVGKFQMNISLDSRMVYLIHFYRAMHFSAKRGIAIACRLSVCLSVCNVGEL